ncbi:MAG TPA: efflux RND transporter periplasmic adaptor subunit [Candidatus Cybelea sp.]|nr:efflux RND transporter periplasmic adaptor subunit [Candidatus Cybelea sp.]
MALFKSNDMHRSTVMMRVGTTILLVLIGASVGAGANRLLGSSGSAAIAASTEAKEKVPNFLRNGRQTTIPDGSPLRGKLTVAAVAQKQIQRTLVLPAAVEADPAHLVKILPPLSGRITQMKVQLGQRVEAGQPLAVLDSSDVGTAYADYNRAKVLLELAQKNRERQRGLAKIGGAADKDLQQAETDFATADAEYQRAEARLKQIGASADPTSKSRVLTITSPIAGSVIDLTVAAGAYWNDATAPLMTVADLTTVWVTANVPEKDTTLVKKGQAVDVAFSAFPGEVFKGAVLFISDVLDPDTRRTKVRIAFPNPDIRLKPGMFANATFFAPPETVPVVPTTALLLNNDANQVFVEVAPWVFEPRLVEINFEQSNEAVVREGLKPGDRVIVKGGVLLND